MTIIYGKKLFCRQILNLVDDFLILALGLEMERESPDSSNDTADASCPA